MKRPSLRGSCVSSVNVNVHTARGRLKQLHLEPDQASPLPRA